MAISGTEIVKAQAVLSNPREQQTQVMTELKAIAASSHDVCRVLFENPTVGILVLNERGAIELVNSRAENLFGYSQGELLDKQIEVVLPQDLRGTDARLREHYFGDPNDKHMESGMELRAVRKNGEVFPVDVSLGHYALQGERIAVAFVTDITERQIAQNELKKLNEDLEARVEEKTRELTASILREKQMNELKSRFVSMASHEFRSPLSVIHSSAALIENYMTEGDERINRHLSKIKSSVKTLTDILDDFLSLDKLEQAKIEIEWETFDIGEFISALLEEMATIQKKGQKFTWIHLGEKRIKSDRKKLRYIVVNFLSNAIKYSGANTIIGLNSTLSDNALSISIKDQGIGIPPEEQKYLFERFFRAKNTATIQGTGLGLSIAKRYVDLMGGHISFSSQPNEGTTFTVHLPQG